MTRLKPILGLFLLCCLCNFSYGQNKVQTPGQSHSIGSGYADLSFIENKGQFPYLSNFSTPKDIEFGAQIGKILVSFTPDGIYYSKTEGESEAEEKQREKERLGLSEKDWKKEAAREKKKKSKDSPELETEQAWVSFVGCNNNVIIEGENMTSDYYTYPNREETSQTLTANGFKKITYKNLYPFIDLVYTFDQRGGLKYQFVVRPGGDPAQIQMKWNNNCTLSLDASGNALISSVVGIFTDHAPVSWMDATVDIPVTSSFNLKGNLLSFNVGNFDNTKTLIIDPWTINPGFTTFNDAFDIQADGAGNVYIYGGSAPYTLKKFTNAGVLLWTYTNTVASWYYGDFTIDFAGNPFMVYGPWGDQCVQLSPAGVMNYNTTSGNSSRETYRVTFNPISGMMDVMGMELVSGLNPMILQINPAGGVYAPSVLNTSSSSAEFRAMCIDGTNGDIFGMSWAGSGSINPVDNFIWKLNSAYVSQWSIADGYNLNEIDASSTDSDFSGYNGLAVGCFLYSYDGVILKKWDKLTGALLQQITVTSTTQYTVGGIATDICGNVYVGTTNSVQQYDANLVLINTIATTGLVFDVHLGNNPGEILACGAGFASSMTFVVGSCNPTTTITATPSTGCPCDGSATVSAQAAACVASNFTYNWLPSGGTGATASNLCPGTYTVLITNTSTGIIDTQTVVVTGVIVSITATVSSVNPTCGNSGNGSATATPTGGTAPYTYLWTPGNQTTQTATGLGPGVYTVTIWDVDSCSTQQTVTLIAPAAFSVATAAVAPILCFGDCNGSVTATPAGPGPFTYSWNTAPIQTTATATGLCDGTYIVTVSDTNNCQALDTITITEPTAVTLVTSAAASICSGACANISVTASGGTPTYSYLWMPGAMTTSSITVCPTVTTTYTVAVTDNNSCIQIDSVVVTILPPPVPVFTVDQQTGCELHCVTFANQTPNSGTITWVYGDNTQGSSNQHCYAAGSYDVSLIVVGTNGCTDTITYANYITAYPNPIASFTVSNDYVSLWEPTICTADNSTNAVAWEYDFADVNDPALVLAQNPCHLYSDTGIYCIELRVTSIDGCRDTAEVCIEIFEEDGSVYIPNTFTPNGNGLNELFLPVGTGINPNEYHFMIFDRWGMLIWETRTWGEGWNGVPKGASSIAQIDTYVWKIACKDNLGHNIARIGHVNLIK